MTHQLVRISDCCIIDLNTVTKAIYDPFVIEKKKSSCTIFLGCDQGQIFYGGQAELVWKLLSDRAVDITPAGGATA